NYVIDPIGAGFVESFARPGGNITGLMAYEPSVVGKWLQMLKEIAPQTRSVALLANPKTTPYYDYLRNAAAAAAPSLALDLVPGQIENDPVDIERVIGAVASMQNCAVVVLPESTVNVHYNLVITLAARHRLPAVYNFKYQVRAGGLMSYGIVPA